MLIAAKRHLPVARQNLEWRMAHLSAADHNAGAVHEHILRNVLGPALGRIEGDDADRIIVLARKEILNNGF